MTETTFTSARTSSPSPSRASTRSLSSTRGQLVSRSYRFSSGGRCAHRGEDAGAVRAALKGLGIFVTRRQNGAMVGSDTVPWVAGPHVRAPERPCSPARRLVGSRPAWIANPSASARQPGIARWLPHEISPQFFTPRLTSRSYCCGLRAEQGRRGSCTGVACGSGYRGHSNGEHNGQEPVRSRDADRDR